MNLLTETVTVIRPGTSTTDGEGNSVEGSPNNTTYRGRLEQTEVAEVQTARGGVVSSGWRLFLPADVDLVASDRVEVDGMTFEVVGPPVKQKTPRGVHHVEARLSLVG